MLSIKSFKEKILNNDNFIFVKRGDGEVACMNGEVGANCDQHPYSIELANDLIRSYQVLEENNAIIVDFENQKDYNIFLHRIDNDVREVSDFFKTIAKSQRTKIFIRPDRLNGMDNVISVNHNVSVPEINLYSVIKEIKIPIIKDGIYLFCAGMPSKVLIAQMVEANPDATYIDCGSSFDASVGNTRTFQITKMEFSFLYNITEKVCFDIHYKKTKETPILPEITLPTVDFIIPTLGREQGLERCLKSIKGLNYPQHLIRVIIDGDVNDTVPVKVKKMVSTTYGDIIVYASNDVEFAPDSLINAVNLTTDFSLIAFNTGVLLADNGNICEHFLIKRNFIKQIDFEIFDTEFHHCGVDNLLWAKASKLGQATRCETAVVHHYHFSREGGKNDQVYQKGWQNVESDRALLKEKLLQLES